MEKRLSEILAEAETARTANVMGLQAQTIKCLFDVITELRRDVNALNARVSKLERERQSVDAISVGWVR